nr:hypothetical protein [Providencia sp.]UNJ80147.1 hypothetical protein [Providencia sp.]
MSFISMAKKTESTDIFLTGHCHFLTVLLRLPVPEFVVALRE